MQSRSANILTVEDSEDLIFLWRSLFAREGIQAQFTRSGHEALSVVDDGYAPDIVMTDFYLPDMTGGDLILELRKRHPKVGALVVTGNTSAEFAKHLPDGTEVLIKPAKFEKVKQAFERLMPLDSGIVRQEQSSKFYGW